MTTPAPRRRRYLLTAELLEDTQLGSGLSGAGINALVARDREGTPVLWASHLEGLLRDVARLRGEASLADLLFGKPGGERQLALFTSLYCSTQENPASRIWRSTARESFDNRAPKDDSLRAVEMVPRGTRFSGHVELPDVIERPPTTERIEHAAILTALRSWLLEVDSVGHGRAAGSGRVRFTLEGAAVEPRRYEHDAGSSHLRLLLRNLEPLCLAATTTPSNLIPTLPYVPGRALLGAVASWLLHDQQHELAAIVTSEQLSFGDALPLPPDTISELDDLELIPAPLALRHEKAEAIPGDIPWWAWREPAPTRRFEDPNAPRPPDMGPRTKGPGGDLLLARRAGQEWLAYRPTMHTRLRNGRPDENRDAPMLFAIESLAENSLLLADLFGPPELLARLVEGLRSIIEGRAWLRLGRAGAPVSIEEIGTRRPAAPAPDEGFLILTSDLLVRDDQLRWYTAVPDAPEARAAFLRHAGLPASLQWRDVAHDATVVRGFNGTARLWRLPLGGIRRGSVFRVSGEGVRELIGAAAEGRWLGERIHEGCGRFRIDPVRSPPGVTGSNKLATRQRKTGVEDDPSEPLCERARMWCDTYIARCKEAVKERAPSLSQWMDLAAALEAGDLEALTDRRNGDTRGKIAWESAPALVVLDELERLPHEQRAAHTRMFVRWLRVWPQQKDAPR